ncbi:MAG: flagellar hook-associated protein FlgK [Nitrospirae bacterium]|nr:flagellar hook-associated protein FlgK [Candidatus Troglogloeales bacterium]
MPIRTGFKTHWLIPYTGVAMPDISGIFNIGRRALSAHQAAIAVTSHNIANVNTPGYSRQEALYGTTPPLSGSFGTGVQIAQVRSVVDTFLQRQIISEQSTLGRFGVEKGLLDRVEAIFSSTDGGIHQAISNFFDAVNDLSNNPSGIAERNALLLSGGTLSQTIRTADSQLKSISQDVNSEIAGRVDEINLLAGKIADLNKQIRLVENSGEGNTANDLRDDRVRLLGELSEKIGTHLLEEEGGDITVTVGSGGAAVALVSGEHAHSLSTVADEDNSGFSKILSSGGTDITHAIADGRLRGLIELRDNLLPTYTDRLDKLAASIVFEWNAQHKKGFDLAGNAGGDFFSPLKSVLGSVDETNTGTAQVVVTAAPLPDNTPPGSTFDSYELSFSDGKFTIKNLDTGASTTDLSVPFEGLDIVITGEAAEGDRFQITVDRAGSYKGLAETIDVALSDPALIAAAPSADEVPGGNGNAILLAQLQDKQVFSLNSTFQGFFADFTGEVGARAKLSQQNLSVEEVLSQKLDTMREEVSGVSLDEETTNLISFQRAYQAAAKLVTTADELLQTVIEMKR